MPYALTNAADPAHLRDHSADARMVGLALGAVVIGTGAAFGAWVLTRLIALATNLFWMHRLSATPTEIGIHQPVWALLLVPVAGAVAIGLMARFGSEKIKGHGIPEAIEAILYGESRLSLKVAVLKPISSAISIGSGGPFGAEGPIIMTGGAIGSLIAQRFHLSAAERKALLVAGAAAGMTGIFGTPLAAVLLAIEVLLFEWKPRSFVPVVIAVVVSLAWRPHLFGPGPMFPAIFAPPTFTATTTMSAVALGTAVGLQATLLSLLLYRIEDLFHRLPVHWMWWPAIGAIAVALGGLADGRVLGAGYANIQALLDGFWPAKVVLTLLILKAIVWLIALGSGTSGGVLAPLLILGAAAGYLAAPLLPGPAGFWAMLGMAGIMSGAMRAPLTGAVFAVELTGRFDALPATLTAAAAAFAVSVLLMRRSILTEKIARRGRHVLQEYSLDLFAFVQAEQIMSRDPQCLRGTMTVGAAIDFFSGKAVHRSYPVTDSAGMLLGLVSRSDALRWQVEQVDRSLQLEEVLSDASLPFAWRHTPIGEVADLMVAVGSGRIPIICPLTRKVIGMLSRHDLLKARAAATREEIERSKSVA